jgi:hypothetical protein
VVATACFLLQASHECGVHPAFPAPSAWREAIDASLGRETRREKAHARPMDRGRSGRASASGRSDLERRTGCHEKAAGLIGLAKANII